MSYYVTTPIYYVNASPHLGHAYTTIAADVVTRFRRLVGEPVFFLTGTDEHGTNIAQAAEKAGMPVQQFVDRNSERFQQLLPQLDAEPDFFIRTTDRGHVATVQEMLTRMHESGDIYEGTYTGLYCEPCEAYYNDGDLLEGGLCPTHKRPVVELDERNWFFRLSRYEQPLVELYRARPDFVRPRSRFNEALSFIEGGLQDLSISRASITWGVPLPWDPQQVAYVWVDALFNYLSALDYATDDDLSTSFWPPDLQLLGKDILKFHAVIWPALLMACGLELPRQLLIHGYLLMGGEKMSKTAGNVFDPFPVIERHGPDPLRFYVLREVQFGQDGSVSQETFEQRYTSELANDLGNLVSRTAAMVARYLPGARVPAVPAASSVADDVRATHDRWRTQMEQVELTAALETVWQLVRNLNRHVEERAPWKLARDEGQRELLDCTLAELVEGLLAVAYMLSPVMPRTCDSIVTSLGGDPSKLAAWAWGDAAGATVGTVTPLFPRLDS